MSQFVVIAPLVTVHAGDRFPIPSFPLHVTLLPPIASISELVLTDVVARFAVTAEPFTVEGLTCAWFGKRSDIRVTVVEAEPARSMHLDLLRKVGSRGARVIEPAYSGAGFVPHVTANNRTSLDVEATLRAESIAVVSMADLPTVLSVHKLGSAREEQN